MSVSVSPSSASPIHGGKLARVLSWLVVVVGLVMLVIGVSVYTVTSNQLADQHITVAAVTADDPGALAGKPVEGPFTAMAQVNAIRHHVAAATGGKTFGELPNVASSDGASYNADITADKSTDGQAHSKGEALSSADAKLYSARATAQQGSLLQASLLVSVIAFGVGALIAGLGLVVVVIGLALLATNRRLTVRQRD